MRLSKRGLITIVVLVVLVVAGLLLPNTNNYEVRTMKVHEVKNGITYLIDGNNEIYGMADEVIDRYADLLVTMDNKGTRNLRDDEIISWRYKN